MSDTMIVQGEDDESPRKCTVKMSPGLGLVNEYNNRSAFCSKGEGVGRLFTGYSTKSRSTRNWYR